VNQHKTMRAKLQVSSVEKFESGAERVKFVAVGGKFPYPADGSDEDNTYAKFSPQADLTMTIMNPALHGELKPGDKFYVDFIRAEK
jgi:hypothetical protein